MRSVVTAIYNSYHGQKMMDPTISKLQTMVWEGEFSKFASKKEFPNIFLLNPAVLITPVQDILQSWLVSISYYIMLAYYFVYEYQCVVFLLSI